MYTLNANDTCTTFRFLSPSRILFSLFVSPLFGLQLLYSVWPKNDIHFEVHYSNVPKLCHGNYKVLLILIMLILRHILSKRELKEEAQRWQ